jgi:RNA recognition motif-containing protein
MRIARLMDILEDWARWMKKDSHKLGYPSKTSYFSTGGESTSEVFEDMVSKSDMENIKIVDAIIDGLSKPQKTAINYRFLGGKKPMYYERDLGLAIDNLLTIVGRRIYA